MCAEHQNVISRCSALANDSSAQTLTHTLSHTSAKLMYLIRRVLMCIAHLNWVSCIARARIQRNRCHTHIGVRVARRYVCCAGLCSRFLPPLGYLEHISLLRLDGGWQLCFMCAAASCNMEIILCCRRRRCRCRCSAQLWLALLSS